MARVRCRLVPGVASAVSTAGAVRARLLGLRLRGLLGLLLGLGARRRRLLRLRLRTGRPRGQAVGLERVGAPQAEARVVREEVGVGLDDRVVGQVVPALDELDDSAVLRVRREYVAIREDERPW
jgi:hypothetical protein